MKRLQMLSYKNIWQGMNKVTSTCIWAQVWTTNTQDSTLECWLKMVCCRRLKPHSLLKNKNLVSFEFWIQPLFCGLLKIYQFSNLKWDRRLHSCSNNTWVRRCRVPPNSTNTISWTRETISGSNIWNFKDISICKTRCHRSWLWHSGLKKVLPLIRIVKPRLCI